MSYDLHVYSREDLGRDALLTLVGDGGPLSVQAAQPGTSAVTVVRGAKSAYSFTVGLAAPLEPEDVPEEITAVLLDPRFLYEVQVEGSSPAEVVHAVRFARKLAQTSKGAMLDQQTGTVWSRGQLRTPPRVDRGLVDIVELRWWITPDAETSDRASAWLELASRHLPEALPRRWGEYEPLSQKTKPAHPDAFAEYVAQAEGTVYFKASAPAIEGHAGTFQYGDDLDSYALSVHRNVLVDRAWRDPLRRLFVDFAVRPGVVLATAEVIRNLEWSGRSLGFTGQSERAPYLSTRHQRWVGLPPYPVWWSWFGPDYVPLVEQHLDKDHVMPAGNGVFHWCSEEPADRDQLAAADQTPPSSSGLLQRWRRKASHESGPWLPTELLATQPSFDPRREAPPLLQPAAIRPPALS